MFGLDDDTSSLQNAKDRLRLTPGLALGKALPLRLAHEPLTLGQHLEALSGSVAER